ncbi:hypothetical protein NM688_g8928 [Phlebia brevispora]|uniref:Uncharacterized protein n=1 Tax=Phlebia brevispora TaxID=194682 RepID=A0ACC1RPY9_9APHY|nr:hypothetical protein NM688_g8928 [Phlebia brevispora]
MTSTDHNRAIYGVDGDENYDVKDEATEEHAVRAPETTHLRGWSAMDKTVREVDEEKIEDTNKDLDALLSFAGLFSAVVTAFVLYSFQNLQEDKTDTVVGLLRQISSQINSSGAQSSVTPSTVPANFSPPGSAIAVNVLWLASLMISLVAASFSIIVKQWLRMYLLVDPAYISPRARLRVRHFRYAGLEDWSVFSIASSLPFLLQVALFLFFVGMCVFTMAVHASVGGTSIAVVVGWGTLFTIVTLAPFLSSRCPYKTPLLNDRIPVWREKLFRTKYFRPLYIGPVGSVSSPYFKGRDLEGQGDLEVPLDECIAAKDHTGDFDIICSNDALLQDDNLFDAATHESLQREQAAPASLVDLACNIIQHRIPDARKEDIIVLSSPPPVAPKCWNTVVDAVARALEAKLQDPGKNTLLTVSHWTSGISLVFCHPAQSLPSQQRVCHALLSEIVFEETCSILQKMWQHENSLRTSVANVWPMVKLGLQDHPASHKIRVVRELLRRRIAHLARVSDAGLVDAIFELLSDSECDSVVQLLADVVDRQFLALENIPGTKWEKDAETIIQIVLNNSTYWCTDHHQMASDPVAIWFGNSGYLIPFSNMDRETFNWFFCYLKVRAKTAVLARFGDNTANGPARRAILWNLANMLHRHNSEDLSPQPDVAQVLLATSSSIFQMLRNVQFSDLTEFRAVITALCRELLPALEHLGSEQLVVARGSADHIQDCLRQLDSD